MKFLRNLLASIIGSIVAFGIVFFMFLIFISLAGADQAVVVKKNSVLELRLPLPIKDYTGTDEADPFAGLFVKNQGLDEILHAIRVAQTDDKISGISINSNFLLAGTSQAQAIRRALSEFKNSGKFVYAYGDIYLQKDYYLASVADSVFINPVGSMDFKGLSAEVLYLKRLQEKTGVKMEVIRLGKYKSAVEPFLDNEMSDENREQISELISGVWESMLSEISESRGISTEGLNQIADTLGARTPEYALASGLIDGILFQDEYHKLIKNELGVPDDTNYNSISLLDYAQVANSKRLYKGRDRMAVIFAEGEILYGEGSPDFIGQGAMTRALRKAREDDRVKAVVLRVNSPGGNALTSDIIWREVILTREIKPVVVSFGDVAASGGYYIAAGADKIFAESTSITGSIGVFGTIPNISGLADNIGVNAEQVGTNQNSVDYSFFEPMSDSFRAYLKEGIASTYQTFLERVASGRNMTVEEVEKVAQGRVWTGVAAQRLGLVDEIGGLEDAIAEAARLADLESFSIRKLPRYKSDFERFMEDIGSASTEIREATLENELGTEAYGIVKEIRAALNQKGIQARMPFTINVR
ncbi:signal peptide peptidase SppA [Lentiprolixibacter aurantiacus]|uniref:Signal peptide peptidase SppA n=1 Tax=Lentiprolixibacter aurantiacus TaxID=2993939 RepID=A0AAE3SMZ5_9FLAO|nr:signal peptide peptidase SppA [Lentiprolixibacter aurantiacus]MCX2719084.1 signal peptide peptidase SppA [Lentiprolixibacter aurantiacus]